MQQLGVEHCVPTFRHLDTSTATGTLAHAHHVEYPPERERDAELVRKWRISNMPDDEGNNPGTMERG
jgi:hypothetical protein